ncbi:MAG: alcohol dehydrogenase catalytic domain-containing protein [Elusimicrobiota bacterium]
MTTPPPLDKRVATMKAGVLRGPADLAVERVPLPAVAPGSVLVKVRACAVCGSDLRIYLDGNPRITGPRVLGHEISGEVAAVGKGVRNFRPGDRVAIGADIPCGACVHCKAGRANCCEVNLAMGYQLDGGFAQYVLLPPLVVKLGPIQKFGAALGFDAAALAEPLACCLNGYERGLMEPGRRVVVFGAGPIGSMLSALGKFLGAESVIVIEPSPERRRWAAAFKPDVVIDPAEGDVVRRVMDLTGGAGGDMIFTACPVVETHEAAVAMVARRGVVNFFGGLPKNAPPIRVSSNHLHYREATVTGSHGSTPEQHRKALRLIESGEIDVKALITHRFALDSLKDALATAGSRKGMKIVVNPNG